MSDLRSNLFADGSNGWQANKVEQEQPTKSKFAMIGFDNKHLNYRAKDTQTNELTADFEHAILTKNQLDELMKKMNYLSNAFAELDTKHENVCLELFRIKNSRRKRKKRFTQEQQNAIRDMFNAIGDKTKVAEKFLCSARTVYRIVNNTY